MARVKSHPMSEFHASWRGTLAPLVDEPIEAVALFNPPGAVAAQAASIAGRTAGGLVGGFLARTAANVVTAPVEAPPTIAAAVTASAVHLFAVETSADALELRVGDHWRRIDRAGLRVTVSRKVMSERFTFASADGRNLELDGMFTPRSKERPYQAMLDLLVD